MLSKRLEAVASFVLDNSSIIDVGCDHGLLDIYLMQNRVNIKAIASDVNMMPLNSAKDNIKKAGLENKIKVILGDGLEHIEKDTDTVILSGLGGKTISDILSNQKKLVNVKQIVASPNNGEYLLKKQVINLGYYIDDEILVLDKNIVYIVISFKKGIKKYNDLELKYGTDFLKKDKYLYKKYINNYLNKYNQMLKSIPFKYLIERYKIKKEIIKIKSLI